MWFSAMANIANILGMAVTYRALLWCVSHTSTGLSKHGLVRLSTGGQTFKGVRDRVMDVGVYRWVGEAS